jgi:cysteine desulfurase
MDVVYLDNNATTKPADSVVSAVMLALTNHWANPSSMHRLGQEARQQLELARNQVARLINAQAKDLVFTSGGTESISLALHGTLALFSSDPLPLVLTTRVEHSALREPTELIGKSQSAQVDYLPLDKAGRVVLDGLDEKLGSAVALRRPVFLSVQWANNETGVIQPIPQIASLVGKHKATPTEPGKPLPRIVFHSDATQAVGKIPVDVKAITVDLLTLAAHKFHGPKGVGGLYIRPGVRLKPQQKGGPQERDRRAGTENIPGILGMAEACRLAGEFLSDMPGITRLMQLRDRLEAGILKACPGAVVSAHDPDNTHNPGPFEGRLWNTTNIGFPRLEAEAILVALSERGVCASAGAACSSGSLEPSPVLLAMGVPEEIAHGAIRFSISRQTTDEQIDNALKVIPQVIAKLSKTLP